MADDSLREDAEPLKRSDQIERVVGAFERGVVAVELIAGSFLHISESVRKLQRRFAPEPRRQEDVREAVVTRVPTDEDRAKEAQGASNRPIREWFSLEDEVEEEIGPREKEILERAKASKENRPVDRRHEEARRH